MPVVILQGLFNPFGILSYSAETQFHIQRNVSHLKAFSIEKFGNKKLTKYPAMKFQNVKYHTGFDILRMLLFCKMKIYLPKRFLDLKSYRPWKIHVLFVLQN